LFNCKPVCAGFALPAWALSWGQAGP